LKTVDVGNKTRDKKDNRITFSMLYYAFERAKQNRLFVYSVVQDQERGLNFDCTTKPCMEKHVSKNKD